MNDSNNFTCSKEDFWKQLWNYPVTTIILVVYIFVLYIVIRHRKTDFSSSFYSILIIIGFCDIFITVCIGFYHSTAIAICSLPLGYTFDAIIHVIFLGSGFLSINMQSVIATNRFVAVVWWNKYATFEEKWTKKLVALACLPVVVIALPTAGSINYSPEKQAPEMHISNKIMDKMVQICGVVDLAFVAFSVIVFYTSSFVYLKCHKVQGLHSEEQKKQYKIEAKLLFIGVAIATPLMLFQLLSTVLQSELVNRIMIYVIFGGNPFLYVALNKDILKRCQEAWPLSVFLKNSNTVGDLNLQQNPGDIHVEQVEQHKEKFPKVASNHMHKASSSAMGNNFLNKPY